MHTPGPWKICTSYSNAAPCLDIIGDGLLIAECRRYKVDPDMSLDNARVISAAPELLAGLQALLSWCGHDTLPSGLVSRVTAAIAKATNDTRPVLSK